MPLDFTHYLANHLRSNGTFNNTLNDDGNDGHVVNTWYGLWALHCLDIPPQNWAAVAAWILNCQKQSGSFVTTRARHWRRPRCDLHLGRRPLSRAPAHTVLPNAEACVRYLYGLADPRRGGFCRLLWSARQSAGHVLATDSLVAPSAGSLTRLLHIIRLPVFFRHRPSFLLCHGTSKSSPFKSKPTAKAAPPTPSNSPTHSASISGVQKTPSPNGSPAPRQLANSKGSRPILHAREDYGTGSASPGWAPTAT